MAIEYLCDDFGAQMHGIHVFINGLLKLGADSEIQAAIQQQELLSRKRGNLNARDVIEAIEAAIPYGHTSKETLERAVEESLKRRSQHWRKLSVKGFLEYAWQGDDDTADEEAAKKLRMLQTIPRLDWETQLDRSPQTELNERRIEQLVNLIPIRSCFACPMKSGIRMEFIRPSGRASCTCGRTAEKLTRLARSGNDLNRSCR